MFDIQEFVEITGAFLSSVKRWKRKVEANGLATLACKPNSGRKSSLNPEQFEKLKQILRAVASGYSNERWNSQRVTKVVFERFSVKYSVKYIPELQYKLGFSQQMPETHSSKRSQAAIDHCHREGLAALLAFLRSWDGCIFVLPRFRHTQETEWPPLRWPIRW